MANYQVNLGVTANVSQAQQSIQTLQNTLQSIANTKITVDGGSIDTAARSAQLLNEHLTRATNAQTGKIDFSALSASLKSANTDLATLSHNLLAMGPKGQQAFSQIANAVAHAELSTRKANSALQNFGVTLMNTIKWQAASSMVHGLISTFNSAVSHIEKLDRSLNSIQIVSNKSSLEMASFAKEAQKAAAALSSTTTEYADAALIYFQQGLNEKAIAERTEATLKMAKVTGTAVTTVSDQLTAIWNNFDDGTESLEHYVDVITALGAATASSTDEISDGLQKFAAIAETVGLSYEYAATALATVTAETRQSADVVGTAFKTLFARIQGLKLGETLDDGTTLNQYSTALAKVGIDIKMSNGELKSMNDILDEMGEKWERLNKDQQVALAQTVGGIRQYNQLIALMDNWDTFKINLEIAEDSKGELDKQFEIYQSSVEASAATLKQAKEALFENILSPDMISGFNEALADTIDLFNTLIENAGGIGKLLEFGGLLLLQTVLPKLQMFLMSAATHIKDFIGYTKAAKMYELDTMAKTSHTIANTSQRTAEHQATTRVGKAAQWVGDKTSGLMDRAFVATAGSTNPATQAMHGALYAATSARDAIKSQTAASEAAFNPNAAAPIDVAGVSMDASAMTMRNQMIQEEAGYTATILDTKKQILALEDGLTDKQREGYKAYSDQVSKEQEALRLAREKQSIAKDTADASKRTATTKVRASDGASEARAVMKKQKMDLIDKQQEEEIAMYKGDDEFIAKKRAEVTAKFDKQRAAVKASTIEDKNIDFSGDRTKEASKNLLTENSSESVTGTMIQNLDQSADGSGPAASVANLEKLGQLQAQYNADAAKANGIYTELSGNIGEAGKRTEQQQKTLKKTGDTMKTLGKDAKTGLVNNLEESAKAMEEAGENASGLRKVIKSLNTEGADIDLGDLNPKEMEAVQGAVGDLGTDLTDASAAADSLADSMSKDMASATNQDAKIFKSIADDAQTAKSSALDADGAAKQLQNTLNTQPPIMPDPFGSVVQGATKAVSAFTSFAMGAQMLSTGITTAFDENATAVEKLMGVMMILQGVMSTLNAVQSVANIVDTIAVAVKAAKAAATKKEADADMKDTVATGANTVATSANAVAKLFAAMASKGLAGIIAGVLGAALIAGTIAIVANTVATQQETEAKQQAAAAAEEEAQNHRDNAKALHEETEELNKNAEAYRKLYSVYEETGEVATDLSEKTYDLALALDVENASLLILQENYEELNRLIEKNLKLKNQEAQEAAKKSKKSAGQAYATAVGASDGYWADAGSDGQYSVGFWAGKDNVDWITNFLNSEEGKKYREAGINFTDGKLIANYNDFDEIPQLMEMYTQLLQDDEFLAYARGAGYDLATGTLFKSWQRMKDENQEAYNGLQESLDLFREQSIITGISDSDMAQADSVNEFATSYNHLIDYILQANGILDRESSAAQELIQQADEYLSQNDQYADLFTKFKASEELPDNVKDYLASKHGGDKSKITDEEYELATKVFIDENALPNEIQTFLDYAQVLLDGEDLNKEVSLVPKLLDSIDQNKTFADWENWRKNFAATYGTEVEAKLFPNEDAYYKFLGMDPESQKDYIRQHTHDTLDVIAQARDEYYAADAANKTQQGITGRNSVEYLEKGAEYQVVSLMQDAQIYGATWSLSGDDADNMANSFGSPISEYIGNNSAMAYFGKIMRHKGAALYAAIDAGFIEDPGLPPDRSWLTAEEDPFTSGAVSMDVIDSAYSNLVTEMNKRTGTTLFSEDTSHTYAGMYQNGDQVVATAYDGSDYAANTDNIDNYFAGGEYDGTIDYTSKYQQTKKDSEDAQNRVDAAQADYYAKLGAQFRVQISEEDLDIQEVMDYAEALESAHSATIETREEAQELALVNSKLTRGLKTIVDNYDEIEKGLKAGKNDLVAYSKALRYVKTGIEDIFDVVDAEAEFSEAFLSSEKTLQLLKKAAEGDVQALQDLRAEAAKDYVLNFGVKDEAKQEVLDLINTFTNSEELDDLEIGASLETTDFYGALETMLNAGKITVDEMNAILGRIGGTPPINYIEVPASEASQYLDSTAAEVLVPDGEGGYTKQMLTTENVGTISGATMIRIPYIGEKHGSATDIAANGHQVVAMSNFTGNKLGKIGGSSGGGGSSSKKAEPTRKADVVERYKEVNDILDDIKEAMDDTNRMADKLWGANRLAAMKKVTNQMKDELDQLKEKKRLAEEVYLAEDLEDLNEATDEAGVARFNIDKNGNITNYDEIMGGLYDELNAAQEAAGDEWSQSEQDKIDAIQERIDKVKEAQENYDATKEEIEDWQNEIEEALLAIQEQYFDIWSEGIEINLAIDEADLAVLDYYLSKIDDDIYGIVESLTLTKQQVDISKDNLEQFQLDKTELDRLHTEIDPDTGETYINDAQYIEGLQDLQSKIYDNLGAINEATETYKNAYSDALAAASEELSNYTDQMEHHNSVLEHYNNLLGLTGQSKNYEKIGEVLSASAQTAENMAAVSKSNYEMLSEKAKEKEAAWLALGKNPGDELTDQEQAVKNEWLAAQQAANEAQDKMLSDAEAWAEALNAVLENKLANLADILDEKLSGEFGSLDNMNTAMERASSLQEEYLTTTNKIYETNKLMNAAQQEIDKTTNTAAKRRLKAYIEETEQLQNKSKLSQYELDIQQAKYDLMLAEIALEEAQSAKSTVRLSRDSEGNFGYVYTADQNAVAEAEQKVADAQNALYNIGLEGANDYAEKYASTIQEMNDEVTALTQAWQEGEIASEAEYQEKMTALKEYYYEKLQGYSELYSIALTTDGQVVQDAWSTQFAGMTSNTENWMIAVDGYVEDVKIAFREWATEMEEVSGYTIGTTLDDLAGKTDAIKTSSDNLVTSITDPNNGVIKALEDELTAVDAVSQAYWEWYQDILSVITAAESLGSLISDIIEEEGTTEDEPPGGDEGGTGDQGDTGNQGDTGDQDQQPPELKIGDKVTVKSSASRFANGTQMQNWVPGSKFEVFDLNGDKVLIGDRNLSGTYTGWVKKTDLVGFASGGYTGDWDGPYGKLAMLHQKELILNQHDTENFLTSMEVLERILQMIDLQSASAQLGGLLASPSFNHNSSEVLEQRVHIEASFPGVQDRNEIEEAFTNLINKASQYANRK